MYIYVYVAQWALYIAEQPLKLPGGGGEIWGGKG